ncbi:putative protein kinase [Trypanosoma grayi]|uniref:putative protein kinase n=1 Tax=Trypanosoma grayi TaxID=71804 RepID=UPI0004F49433|nr:putative protein kinase [Trypanosoma grayi]KEG09103.1 putative protein kinase [Trypanosoma grayi]
MGGNDEEPQRPHSAPGQSEHGLASHLQTSDSDVKGGNVETTDQSIRCNNRSTNNVPKPLATTDLTDKDNMNDKPQNAPLMPVDVLLPLTATVEVEAKSAPNEGEQVRLFGKRHTLVFNEEKHETLAKQEALPREVMARFHQSIAARDLATASPINSNFNDDSSPERQFHATVNSHYSGFDGGQPPSLPSTTAAQSLLESTFSPSRVRMDLAQRSPRLGEMQGTPLACDLRHGLISRLSGHRLANSLTGENQVENVSVHDDLDARTMSYTVLHYMSHRPKPAVHALPLRPIICTMLASEVVFPFALIALIFGLYYWATTRLISALSSAETGAVSPGATSCGSAAGSLQKRCIGSLSREAFNCMMGILIAFIIVVVGGAILLWVFPWHYMYSSYLQTLAFICDVAPTLSRIRALTPKQEAIAPKRRISPLFWREKREKSVITGVVENVVLLGKTLHELKWYIPHTERQGVLTSVLNCQNCDVTMSQLNGERHSDCVSQHSRRLRETHSGHPSPQEDLLVSASNSTNPLLVDNISPSIARRGMVAIHTNIYQVAGSSNSIEEELLGPEDTDTMRSPVRRRYLSGTRLMSSNGLNASMNSSTALITETCRTGMACNGTKNENTGLEDVEAKGTALNDFGFWVQQVTFLVCRLFLPKLEVHANGSFTEKSAVQAQEISKQFLAVVLRVAKEECGVPFDLRLDCVIVTFHTRSGPNSVNLVQPRNCAFRMVSELTKLESSWSHNSSTSFTWGIAMHMSQLVIGLSSTASRQIAWLYGEEVKLAHRVAELCSILDCPLLMLQPCYDVFRVCVTAVPVDVIYKETSDGKVRIYLYEPKALAEEENLYTKREHYAPLTDAFGLMCEKKFTEAAKKLEGILDLDHNAPRLYSLCKYFLQQQRDGKIDVVLPYNTMYVRSGLQWEPLESEARKYLQECQSQCEADAGHTFSHNNSGSSHTQGYVERRETFDMKSEATDEARLALTPVRRSVLDASGFGASDASPLTTASIPYQPSNLTQSSHHLHDMESGVPGTGSVQPSFFECGEGNEISVRYSQRVAAMSSVFSEADFDGDTSFHQSNYMNESSVCSREYGENNEGRAEFDIYEPLGKGSFGIVYRGLHPDGNIVAIKEYPFPDMDENDPRIQSSRSEIEMLAGFHHENIVRYINSCFQNGALYIITEFVSGGSLSALVKTFQCLPRDTIRRYTGDILRGLQYLHERQIVHRDISPNNVLVSIDGVCKLSDFGGAVECAMQITEPGSETASAEPNIWSDGRTVLLPAEEVGKTVGTVMLKNCFGTPVCMSPDACSGIVDPKNDIWGLGITLCFCFSGRYPWPEGEMLDVGSFIGKLSRGVLTPKVPYNMMDAHAADFIDQCLRKDARARLTAAQLLFHSFMVS